MIPEINYKNFSEFLDGRIGNKTLMINPEDDSRVSYGEANAIASKTANFLSSLGIKKDDKVAFISLNCFEFIYVFFACQKIGAVFHPVNPSLSEDELCYILDNSDTICVFADEENLRKINLLKGKLGRIKNIFRTDFLARIDGFHKDFNDHSINLDCDSILMYSSGTTGFPKGIVLTQRNLLCEGYSIMRALRLSTETVGFVNLPLFFSGGLLFSFMSNACANEAMVLPIRFSKNNFWKIVDKFKVTWTMCVPTMLSFLLNPPEDISSYNTSSLRFVCSGAAPVPVDVMKSFEKSFGVHIVEVYGLTENTALTTISPVEKEKIKMGSVGKAMDIAEMKVVDGNGNECKDGEEGEIMIKGPHVFREYYRNPEATKKALENGWLHSGDLGYRDKEGYYYVSGRIKEIIKKGGVLISPVAIDRVFYQHDAVQDAATIGVPDKMYGEEIVTFVVLKQGKEAKEGELKEFCMNHLEKFKCPKEIVFADSIPKGPSGKLLRRELLKSYLEGKK
ncbi:acyl--CoA ligase [Candidatus Woesearchaeota archaeon]|nr:acyl--CoA ligase [Candidatus Woesearchaeota archaeon]